MQADSDVLVLLFRKAVSALFVTEIRGQRCELARRARLTLDPRSQRYGTGSATGARRFIRS